MDHDVREMLAVTIAKFIIPGDLNEVSMDFWLIYGPRKKRKNTKRTKRRRKVKHVFHQTLYHLSNQIQFPHHHFQRKEPPMKSFHILSFHMTYFGNRSEDRNGNVKSNLIPQFRFLLPYPTYSKLL